MLVPFVASKRSAVVNPLLAIMHSNLGTLIFSFASKKSLCLANHYLTAFLINASVELMRLKFTRNANRENIRFSSVSIIATFGFQNFFCLFKKLQTLL